MEDIKNKLQEVAKLLEREVDNSSNPHLEDALAILVDGVIPLLDMPYEYGDGKAATIRGIAKAIVSDFDRFTKGGI